MLFYIAASIYPLIWLFLLPTPFTPQLLSSLPIIITFTFFIHHHHNHPSLSITINLFNFDYYFFFLKPNNPSSKECFRLLKTLIPASSYIPLRHGPNPHRHHHTILRCPYSDFAATATAHPTPQRFQVSFFHQRWFPQAPPPAAAETATAHGGFLQGVSQEPRRLHRRPRA